MPKVIVAIVVIVILPIAFYLVFLFPSYLEVNIRAKADAARKQQKEVKSLLDSYRDAFPQNGKELREYFLSRSDARILVDPYTGKDFSFATEKANHNITWYLISAGPDRKIQSIPASSYFLRYDPTNGMISAGDIVSTGTHDTIYGR